MGTWLDVLLDSPFYLISFRPMTSPLSAADSSSSLPAALLEVAPREKARGVADSHEATDIQRHFLSSSVLAGEDEAG